MNGKRWSRLMRRGKPSGVVAVHYPRGSMSRAHRIHRGALLGVGRGRARPFIIMRNAALYGVWQLIAGRRAMASIEEQLQSGASPTIPISVQRSRLSALSRRHCIAPVEAFRLGLTQDHLFERWPEFVFESETGWNLAASLPQGRAQLRLLSDKVRTSELLALAGVAVPEQFVVPAHRRTPRDLESMVRSWLCHWPQVHGKPRFGARGVDSFRIEPHFPTRRPDHRARSWTLRDYRTNRIVEDPIRWLADRVRSQDYVVQPHLLSHPAFDGLACISDVVTQRIVTRLVRDQPRVFSAILEVPLRNSGKGHHYLLMMVDEHGVVTSPVRPAWLRQTAAHQTVRDHATRALIGSTVPGFTRALSDARTAHSVFPHAFAIAWDVAITDGGPMFLEGNAGFSTEAPQWVAGGMLAGLD